jgi:D-sedoheptulose 7-phosphate isomerase
MRESPIHAAFVEAQRVLSQFAADADAMRRVREIGDVLAATIRGGGKILICGNGGSLCDAAHFAEELTGRFRDDRRPLPAIACADAGHLTCVANDYGFEHVFSRWIRGLARAGDAVIVLTTSGNSPNITAALVAAAEVGAVSIALLGKAGGACRGKATHEVIVPGATSDRIQELHMIVLHAWVEHIELALR